MAFMPPSWFSFTFLLLHFGHMPVIFIAELTHMAKYNLFLFRPTIDLSCYGIDTNRFTEKAFKRWP